ncbi:unnamed protein product [Spodoptera littoralis]|uniref:Uncharacterized protein n=1 Tax=Spodoptera littoralis TaxID=7109 RepID=A0A9P0IBD8_SPOLI|nr:unnamed protein product [Spodoptera littoralis]CAH1643808.1 unnamed protein product [Spodoptera littoralis]
MDGMSAREQGGVRSSVVERDAFASAQPARVPSLGTLSVVAVPAAMLTVHGDTGIGTALNGYQISFRNVTETQVQFEPNFQQHRTERFMNMISDLQMTGAELRTKRESYLNQRRSVAQLQQAERASSGAQQAVNHGAAPPRPPAASRSQHAPRSPATVSGRAPGPQLAKRHSRLVEVRLTATAGQPTPSKLVLRRSIKLQAENLKCQGRNNHCVTSPTTSNKLTNKRSGGERRELATRKFVGVTSGERRAASCELRVAINQQARPPLPIARHPPHRPHILFLFLQVI